MNDVLTKNLIFLKKTIISYNKRWEIDYNGIQETLIEDKETEIWDSWQVCRSINISKKKFVFLHIFY